MRKFILPILVAGAVAFTAAQAFAGANTHTGSFHEDHATANTLTGGPITDSLIDATPTGDHYKVTTATEAGAHGNDFGGWQLDSGLLKLMANGGKDGDTSWGYTTGADPFVMGNASDTAPTDTFTYPAPAYTLPCPVWIATGPAKGTCPANVNADDPQTEVAANIWDGTVLDDLYQAVGVDDSTAGTGYNRILDQTLDQLFYSGKRGRIWYDADGDGTSTGDTNEVYKEGKIGTSTVPGTGRIFNIDDTLDQDLADYLDNSLTTGEVVGIFNKLTMNFQLAGKQLDEAEMNALGFTTLHGFGGGVGCSSWGGGHGGGEATCEATSGGEVLGGTTFYDLISDTTNPVDMVAIWGKNTNNFAAVMIEQWLDAEIYDWNVNSTDPKVQGLGMKQELSTYFRDGSAKNYNYTTDIKTGHGTVNKNVTLPSHGSIDP